jgi:predicted nucleic acid-binding protein
MTAKIAPSRPWAYFDSSALVKRYIAEPGRREVLKLMRQHACVTSALTPVELRSAIRRRVAEGTLDGAQVPAVLKRLAEDRLYWTIVEVGKDVLVSAESLVATHPIRALDALHVASASIFGAHPRERSLTFVSGDHRQTDVAAAQGMIVRAV